MAPDDSRSLRNSQTNLVDPRLQLHPEMVSSPMAYSDSDKQRYREASPGQKVRIASDHLSKQPIGGAVSSTLGEGVQLSEEQMERIASKLFEKMMVNNQDTQPTNVEATAPSVPSDNSPPLSHRQVYTPPSPHRPISPPRAVDDAADLTRSPTRSTHSGHGRFSPDNSRRRGSTTGSSGEEKNRPKSGDEKSRPKPLTRQPTDITTLEKIWGPLFEGPTPTPRLGQLLRGIALHLIEDFEPKQSLVVTPVKMQTYYELTKLPSEYYPWDIVFDNRTSSISRLYRELIVQHHLVQDDELHKRPDIPGLTPQGFERWATLMIQAYPDEEYDRLTKTMMDMPICNFDNRSERFPKEISRRLFPKTADLAARDTLAKAVVEHCKVPFPGSNDASRPPNAFPRATSGSDLHRHQTRTESTVADPQVQAFRSDYSIPASTHTEHHESAIEDDDKPVNPIERTRKPYVAAPGKGRNYDDINRPADTSRPSETSHNPSTASAPEFRPNKTRRSSSTTAASRPDRSHTIPVTLTYPIQTKRGSMQPGMETISTSIPSASDTRARGNSILTPGAPHRSNRHRSPSATAQHDTSPSYRRESDVPASATVYNSTGGYAASYGDRTSPKADFVEPSTRHYDRERDGPRYRADPTRLGERDYLPTAERDRMDRSSMYEMGTPAGLGLRERSDTTRERRYVPTGAAGGGYSVSDTGRAAHGYSEDEDYYRGLSRHKGSHPGREGEGETERRYYR